MGQKKRVKKIEEVEHPAEDAVKPKEWINEKGAVVANPLGKLMGSAWESGEGGAID